MVIWNTDRFESRRKAFLQFSTRTGSLPIGGLRNLNPPLTIGLKITNNPQEFPTVSTCTHLLRIPHSPSKEVMKQKLSTAILIPDSPFHFS